MSLFLIFFFFKQKTAYEMRISDWSSDVCSSDLECAAQRRKKDGDRAHKNEHRYDRTEQRAYKVQLFHGHPAQPQPSRRPSPLSRKPRRSRAERRMLSSTSLPLRATLTSPRSTSFRRAETWAPLYPPYPPAASSRQGGGA